MRVKVFVPLLIIHSVFCKKLVKVKSELDLNRKALLVMWWKMCQQRSCGNYTACEANVLKIEPKNHFENTLCYNFQLSITSYQDIPGKFTQALRIFWTHPHMRLFYSKEVRRNHLKISISFFLCTSIDEFQT